MREGEAEVVGVVDFGAFVTVESLGGFATLAGGEAKLGATFGGGPFEHGLPEGGADALTADGAVGDEIFKVGDTADDGSHDDAKGGDALDFAGAVDGEEHVVRGGIDKVSEPLFGDFSAVFAAAR